MSDSKLLLVILILGILTTAGLVVPQVTASESYPMIGPMVDSLQYVVINNETEQVQALINGSIDLIASDISQGTLSLLEGEYGISIVKTPGKETTRIFINCARYPFNLTAFRRALAFALNKTGICDDLYGGLAIPIDAYISEASPFSIEGELAFSYHQGDPTAGNLLLNASGFGFDGITGDRKAPDDSPLNVLVEHDSLSPQLLEYITDALTSLHINWTIQQTDFWNIVASPTDYDIFCSTGGTYDGFDIRNFANYFRSAYVGNGFMNLPNFDNASIDTWSQQLAQSHRVEDLFEAATEMQKIVAFECPIILLYDLCIVNAYRTDRISDVVALGEYGLSNSVTNRLGNLLDVVEEYGGTLRIGISSGVSDLNFMRVFQDHWKGWLKTDSMKIMENLYDSLMVTGPDGMDHPWLAESYLVDTHEDDSNVPEGTMRVTFTIVDNATWSDDTPISANDVEYSLEFYIEGYEDYSNLYGTRLSQVTGVSAPNSHTVVVDVSSTSYWDIHSIVHVAIIPEHYFVTVGPYGWDSWDPSIEELVLSGHFLPTTGDIYSLDVNEDHFRFYRQSALTTPSSTTTPTPTTTQIPVDFIPLLAFGMIGVGIILVIVIVIRSR